MDRKEEGWGMDEDLELCKDQKLTITSLQSINRETPVSTGSLTQSTSTEKPVVSLLLERSLVVSEKVTDTTSAYLER